MPKIDPHYHPAFPQPDDVTVLVWRYMDLAKLLGIFLRNELPLVRLDQLPDEYEGMFPDGAQDSFIDWLKSCGTVRDEDIEANLKIFRVWSSNARLTTYVSCWRLDNFESEAMWRIYCGTANGVAIALSYEELFKSVDVPAPASTTMSKAMVGEMTYMNFRAETFQPGNQFSLAMHKRREFNYECEVRIAKLVTSPVGAVSVSIPWPTRYIQKIVVGPYAQSWFAEVVREVVERLAPGMSSKVVESSMKVSASNK